VAHQNRLAGETSPYLRQHADNPVDWYPWGDDAMTAAKERDVPILLSVGYSACHWCHVMAHESFEDDATAALMNELFVNVKVDREERPDVDAIYMDAVQAMTGQGGWPMTVFLTPAGKPFFGGTYFPRDGRGGMMSFTDLCRRIDEVWRTRRPDIEGQADDLTDAVGQAAQLAGGATPPGVELLDHAADQLAAAFEPRWGGFGHAPKFPGSMSLDLLLRLDRHPEIVRTSLDAMAAGGIYDHLGGGFARYSTDDEWLVPHFEKMLYDQALLIRVYLHSWQATGSPDHRQVLDETIGYVLRDLRHPQGGFFSAEDADSEGVEGKFYVWTLDEVRAVLGDGPGADAAIEWYGVTERGNWEGTNILRRPLGAPLARPPEIESGRARLLDARDRRIRPGLDDKVLTEWNGLMLASLAEAAAATGDEGWLTAAIETADFLLGNLRRDDGRWMRSWQADAGRPTLLGYAADHAAMVDALVRLNEATGERRWLDDARATADILLDRFWDDERGGLFTTGTDAPALVSRPKDLMDNAVPSANSVAAVGLLRLGALTGETRYEEAARAIIGLLGALSAKHPLAFGNLLAAVDLDTTGITEVVITGERRDLVDAVTRAYRPRAVLAWGERYESPLWAGRDEHGAGGQAYVCRNYACRLPVTAVDDLRAQLAG
jgi:uncharacterized protein YyaL (SSP411 family)